jgi:hypothetical protein
MEYLAYVKRLELPHWLIIAGGAAVLFGVAGRACQTLGTGWH